MRTVSLRPGDVVATHVATGITLWQSDLPDDYTYVGTWGAPHVGLVVQLSPHDAQLALVVAEGTLGWCRTDYVVRVPGT